MARATRRDETDVLKAREPMGTAPERSCATPPSLLGQNRRAAGRDHQHPVVRAEDLVVEIDADDGVGAERLRVRLELGDGEITRPFQLPLVGGRAAADDVADAGEDVLEDVRTENRLAGDDTEVFRNALSLDVGRGGDQHDVASFRYWRLVNDTARAISDFTPGTMLSASAYSSRRCGVCSSVAPIATAGM